MDYQTIKAINLLGNKWVVLGPMMRKKGALALIGTSAPAAVKPLITALKDENEYIRNAADNALSTLKGAAVNELCSIWSEKRDDLIKTIIKKSGYIADSPPELRIKTTFLQEKQINQPLSQDIVEDCLMDSEISICSGAIDYTLTSPKDSAFDYLWNFAKRHPETMVAGLLHQRNMRPEDISEQALFYFMAGDFAKYHQIDNEQKHLKNYYETAPPELKKIIIDLILRNCDKGLLLQFKTALGIHKSFPSKEEVNLQIAKMINNNDFSGLFGLLPFATYTQGRRITNTIHKAKWIHQDVHKRELQYCLEKIFSRFGEDLPPSPYASIIFQDFRPMFLCKEDLPGNDLELATLAQNKEDFRRRGAAVIAMTERGSPNLKDVANQACGDEYWQVRMAAAMAEMSHPGTLLPSNRALLSKDHVYWVQALLNIPSDGRLCDLCPDDLNSYRNGGTISDHRNPDTFYNRMTAFIHPAVREYLLTLAEFNEYF